MDRAKMAGRTVETSPQFYARMAGACYLLGALASVFGQMIIPDRLVVSSSAATTAGNILAHESSYRFGAVLAFMSVPFHLVWAILFYRLFKPVNKSIPLLAAFVMLMGCVMWTLCAFFSLAVLNVLKGTSSLSAFAPEQLQTLALVLLRLNAQAYDIGLVFFGLWCLLVGYLIAKSTFLPRTIGVLYALAGVGYLTLLWQPLAKYLYPYNLALAGPGEVSLLLWLLVKGVNVPKWKEQATDLTRRCRHVVRSRISS
jgi:hypothetical protein